MREAASQVCREAARHSEAAQRLAQSLDDVFMAILRPSLPLPPHMSSSLSPCRCPRMLPAAVRSKTRLAVHCQSPLPSHAPVPALDPARPSQVCEDAPGCASRYLQSLMQSEASLAASVLALVDYAIACGLADEGRRARLMQLWGIWLKGVGWAKCTMSHTNR